MGRGFRGRERKGRGRADEDAEDLDEAGIRIDAGTVSTARGEYALERIVAVRSSLSRPLWGPVVLAVLGTLNLATGFDTGALRDFVAAGIMLGAGVLWRSRGVRHILILNVGGTEEAPWATRDGELMERVVQLLEAHVASHRAGADEA